MRRTLNFLHWLLNLSWQTGSNLREKDTRLRHFISVTFKFLPYKKPFALGYNAFFPLRLSYLQQFLYALDFSVH